jgi:predicted amidohydrolase
MLIVNSRNEDIPVQTKDRGRNMARYVRVSTISFGGVDESPEKKIEANLREALRLLRRSTLDKPDIVCLPEAFATLGFDVKQRFQTAQSVEGPITQAVGELARRFSMYVICPMVERKDGKVYNSAVLIDRQGKPIGSYHKMYPTPGEIESGITPGTDPTVFRTDFGRVGCAICYDLNFRDVIQGLATNGAELVFFPSMYRGGLQLSIWAFDFELYIASAYTGDGSLIVNPLGRVLIQSSSNEPIVTKTINLDCKVLHTDDINTKWEKIKAKYGPDVDIEVATPEDSLLITSHTSNVSVDQIIKEFQLETRKEEFERAIIIRKRALQG